jgi:hypothetical protein
MSQNHSIQVENSLAEKEICHGVSRLLSMASAAIH